MKKNTENINGEFNIISLIIRDQDKELQWYIKQIQRKKPVIILGFVIQGVTMLVYDWIGLMRQKEMDDKKGLTVETGDYNRLVLYMTEILYIFYIYGYNRNIFTQDDEEL